MSFIQNFFTSRDNNANAATYVGQQDRIWYNPITQTLYVSNGTTPGGIPINLATGANITANVITVNTITSTSGIVTVTGNLSVLGNISPASNVKIGGISAGPGVVISNEGELTIDTANLPLSFGNFTASNNVLSIVNVDENMILQTEGNAEIQLVGNVGFYKPDGIPPDAANLYAFFNSDGQVTIYVPQTDPLSGAVKIIGSASGNFTPPVNTGVMLQITGQNNDASRFYNDSIGSFAAFVGRRINGNVASPTAVLSGQEIIRISSTGYDGTEIPGGGTARIVFQAMENYTPTARGSNLSFWATAVSSNVLSQVANVTVENGLSATKFSTPGNISATGNITGGNINTVNLSLTGNVIGNVITAGLVSATGNITGGNILTSGLVSATGSITSGDGMTATGNVTTPSTFVGNLSGLITRRVRDAGTIADGGTLTIDFSANDLVKCVWNNGLTIAANNITQGRVIRVMATKGTGSGTDSITLSGFTAGHTTTGSLTQSYAADTTAIIEFIATNNTIGEVYIKF